ncbi:MULTISPECIES: AlpA family transcriptional regulator [unclassified Mesorhizobium]|uniref:helix-turn-helix transcriptional regulator n=1 Tax=unclassified Mesorhizobium TaxID=325217 RepID=UPI0007EDC299|nr:MULTISPECIES: AlpA family transcriptional regulator [unclassified Mesorhizobium]QIA23653.1 AlpA family transcriptional regulator [Mesorhizobium sp. AA22]TIR28752.1 MAG: AlpA family transcriptional regulator [Mesorhizobium sp.]TIS23842.1 MAG: AlpA family transcriptional regulator [Mesorhizobium sp.]
MKTFLRRPEVQRLTGLSTSSMYEVMKAGMFPKPIRIGPKAVAWDAEEITAWQERCLAQRDSSAAA